MRGSTVSDAAFLPDHKTAASRNDSMVETSINWEDDDRVVAFTLARREQTEHGVARVLRSQLDYVRQLRHCIGQFGYERREVDGNPHHGNLLFGASCGKPMEKMIASVLALDAEYIPRK